MGRPPAAPSATQRQYPPCTREDAAPHRGHRADDAADDAEITTASAVSSTWCTRSPDKCGNSTVSRFPPSSKTSTGPMAEHETEAEGMTG